MPRPTSKAPLPHLVPLLFGGSLAAVGLLFGLVVWRLVHLPQSSRPAATRQVAQSRPTPPQRQSLVNEVVVPVTEANPAPPPPLRSENEERPLDSSRKETIDTLPNPPQALTADQIFEQRLQIDEDELRRQLYEVPELLLLADKDVRDVRAKERVAARNAARAARAALGSAPRGVSLSTAGVRDRRLRAAIREEERVMRAAVAAEAKRERAAAITSADEQISYEYSLDLQRAFQHAGRQAGLPLQSGPRCQLAPQVAASVAQLSKSLRDLGFVTALGSSPTPPSAAVEREDADVPTAKNTKAFRIWCDRNRVERLSGSVPTLTQMLQIEDEPSRLLLVRELARVKSTASTIELADRAVMDLAPEVRRAAVAALSCRSAEHYLPILTRALRYPWPPVADHAAVALRALQPQEAVSSLLELLDLPSPSLPAFDSRTRQYSVRELVRLNHMRNCLLCHAASVNKEDGLVRGLVPTPGMSLPNSNGGRRNYYEGEGDFVRADITYLRQDFSEVLLDKDVAPWPQHQRFDFVTRRRIVPPEMVTELSASPANYPQRDAVLYALRGMTGKDGGDSSDKWRPLLGIAKEDKH